MQRINVISFCLKNIRFYSARPGRQNTFYIEKSKLEKSLHDKIPVICLMGWAGARDSHLKKYEKIYSDLGYHTVRFSPSNSVTFLKKKDHIKHANEFISLFNSEFKENKFMFHFFSNACIFSIYHLLINRLDEPDLKFMFNQRGQIFDSGMGWVHGYFQLYEGLNNLLETEFKSEIVKRLVSANICLILFGYTVITLNNNYFTNAFQRVIDDKRKDIATLYLYSRADKLISHHDITKKYDERLQILKNYNINSYIKSVIYDDADHVLIYAKHTDNYLKQIKQHLKVCNLII
jgi:hypothetical protein